MSNNGTLVRTDLTEQEWADFRKLAIDLRLSGRKASGDALRAYLKSQRALLKGAKP